MNPSNEDQGPAEDLPSAEKSPTTESSPQDRRWVIDVTVDSFQSDVLDQSSQRPVVVDFWASWCAPCRMLGPLLEKLAEEFDGQFVLAKIDSEAHPDLAAQFGVQSIPAVYGLRNGEVVLQFNGLLPEEQLRDFIGQLLPTEDELLVQKAEGLQATDPQQAEQLFGEAITKAKDPSAARIGLARLLLQENRLEESAALIQKLEDRGFLEPEAEQIQGALAIRLKGSSNGDVAASRDEAQQAPEDLDAQLRLASALAADQQCEEAMQICLDVLTRNKKKYGEPVRKMMVDMFHMLGPDSELVSQYRRKLSVALY
jgi:putative thioredoxin